MKNYILIIDKNVYLKTFLNYNEAVKWAHLKFTFTDTIIVQEYNEIIEYKQFEINLN